MPGIIALKTSKAKNQRGRHLAAVVWRRAGERKGAVRINKLIAWQLSEEDFHGITNPKLSFNKDGSDVLDHIPENATSVLHVIEKPDEDK